MAGSASGGTGVLVNREAVVSEFTFVGGAKVPGIVLLQDGGLLKWELRTRRVDDSKTVKFHGLQFSTNVRVQVVNGTAYIEYE